MSDSIRLRILFKLVFNFLNPLYCSIFLATNWIISYFKNVACLPTVSLVFLISKKLLRHLVIMWAVSVSKNGKTSRRHFIFCCISALTNTCSFRKYIHTYSFFLRKAHFKEHRPWYNREGHEDSKNKEDTIKKNAKKLLEFINIIS